jgi:hypothetical protein
VLPVSYKLSLRNHTMTNYLASSKLPAEIGDKIISTPDLYRLTHELLTDGISAVNVKLLIDLVSGYWENENE